MSFGRYIRDLRKGKSLTVRKLEELSGVSASYITNVENEKRGVPSPDILKKLAAPLGVNVRDLLIEAGHIEKSEMIDPDSLEFATSNIGIAIVEILDAVVKANPRDIKAVERFKAALMPVIQYSFQPVDSLFPLLVDVEPDGDQFPSFGTVEQTGMIETLLHLLQKSKRDAIKLLGYDIRLTHPEIVRLLTTDGITYNGHPLTDQDKQRILDVLKALFPDYQ